MKPQNLHISLAGKSMNVHPLHRDKARSSAENDDTAVTPHSLLPVLQTMELEIVIQQLLLYNDLAHSRKPEKQIYRWKKDGNAQFCKNGKVGKSEKRKNGNIGKSENGKAGNRKNEKVENRKNGETENRNSINTGDSQEAPQTARKRRT